MAITGISDESILINIARNDSNIRVRIKAIKKINDVAVLSEINKNDSNVNVRIEARNRIIKIRKHLRT